MKFEFYSKTKSGYDKVAIDSPENSGTTFLQSLKLTVLNESENINKDIVKTFGDEEVNSLSRPISKDKDKQNKINQLIEFRKINNKTKEILINLLFNEDFIFCDRCNGKMKKIPINVLFTKFGEKYIIKDEFLHSTITYIYGCDKDNCTNAIGESEYNWMMNHRKAREESLEKGNKWVPNDFGTYFKHE